MTFLGGRQLTIILAAVVVVSMVGPTVVVAGGPYEEDQFHEVPDASGVEVWERAAFSTLHVDYAAGEPETLVQHPEPSILTQDPDIGEAGLNRHQTGVWGSEGTIPVTFTSWGAETPTTQFEGDQWDLVVARTDGGSLDLGGADASGDLFRAERALELLSDDAEADWEIAGTKTYSGSPMTFQYDLSQPDREPGAYAFFLVKSGTVSVDGSGDLTTGSDVKVIGVDTTLVQDAEASIVPERSRYAPGEDVSFEVSSNVPDAGSESQFTHAVLLYDEEEILFVDPETGSTEHRLRLEFDGTVDQLPDAEASEFTLDTTYGAVEGVVRADGSVDVFGIDVDDREESGEFTVETLADALLPEVGLDGMDTETGDAVLDVSMTAVETTESDTTVEVGTTENFSPGRYDVLYVVEGRDTGQVATERTSVLITPDPPRRPPRRPVGPDPSPPAEPGPGPKVDVEPDRNAASIAFERVEANTRTVVELPEPVGTELASLGSLALNTSTSHPSLQLSVRASDTVPEGGTPELDVGEAISYIEVTVDAEDEVGYNDAVFTFDVPAETLEDRDLTPDRVRLFRYNEDEGAWQELPTDHQGGTTYTATSPGFSVFAIGSARQEQQPANLGVSDAAVDPTEVEVGETVEVTATLENTGEEEATFTVDLAVDGGVVDSTDVTLGPGESTEVQFEHAFEEAGSYDVSVAGESAGTVEVTDDGPGESVEEGFISPAVVLLVIVVLLAVGVAAAYYVRSSDGVDPGR